MRKSTSSHRAGLTLSVALCRSKLRRASNHGISRLGKGAPVYMAAVLEFLVGELLEGAGAKTQEARKKRITPMHILKFLKSENGEDLQRLCNSATLTAAGITQNHPADPSEVAKISKRKKKRSKKSKRTKRSKKDKRKKLSTL